MSFAHVLINDVLKPEYGSGKSMAYNTRVQRGQDRRTRRVTRSENALRQWDIAALVNSPEEGRDVFRFFMAMQGTVTGFLYSDGLDFTSAADDVSTPDDEDQEIGVGDGSTTDFQLVKRYVHSFRTETLRIEKPVAGTVVVSLDGVAQASGWTVNTTTGIVTFSTPPADGVAVRAGFEFDWPVRFATELAGDLGVTHDSPTIEALDAIILEELPNEGLVADYVNRGGATSLGAVAADFTISPLQGQVIRLDATAACNCGLPAIAGLPRGEYWTLINTGASGVTIRDSLANPVGSIGTPGFAKVYLIDDGAGNSAWSVLSC